MASRSYCQELSNTHCAIPTKVSTIIPEGITLYPNPILDVLQVELKGASEVAVFDILGRQLWTKNVMNNTSIDFSPFPKGAYFVKIDHLVFKVIKGI